jgi:hypothetical protein
MYLLTRQDPVTLAGKSELAGLEEVATAGHLPSPAKEAGDERIGVIFGWAWPGACPSL